MEDVANFIRRNYEDTTTSVLIYEDAGPHYIIAASTGSPAARTVLISDTSQDCPEGTDIATDGICTANRATLDDFGANPDSVVDSLLRQAAYVHINAGYPERLISLKTTTATARASQLERSFLVSQSALYNLHPGISWRILVVMPGMFHSADSIIVGDSLFAVLCVVASLGFLVCFWFLVYMVRRRQDRAVVYADWKFTCAFIFGCCLLNVSSFTLLGDNTDDACLARMWTFHLFFAIALSPLYVKIWRIKKLVGFKSVARRRSISNIRTALYTLVVVVIQIIILLVFTFVDPPVATDFIDVIDEVVTERITCATDTNAFFITEAIYEGSLVLSGCVLAYMTRNLNKEFGESKQLFFAVYNIALVGLLFVLSSQVSTKVEVDMIKLFQAVAVFWGTVFSTAAFVIPRMLQVQQAENSSRKTNRSDGPVLSSNTPNVNGLNQLEEN